MSPPQPTPSGSAPAAATAFEHTVGFSSPPSPLYFDRLTPTGVEPRGHVVLVHGGGHTGSCYLLTADGRSGWAQHLAAHGYLVTVPDWPGHGRSGAADMRSLGGEEVSRALARLIAELDGPVVLVTHSMSGAIGWRTVELAGPRIAAVIGVAPAPPGNVQAEPEVVEDTDEGLLLRTPTQTISFRDEYCVAPDPGFAARKLVGESRQFPRDRFDAYTGSLSPTGSRLIYERMNVRGSQVRVEDPSCFAGKPILIVTGGEDLDHPRELDEAVAEWLAEQGAEVRFAWLPDLGIEGNGHMLMMERNSDEIAQILVGWLDEL